jgi:hypothetical protein
LIRVSADYLVYLFPKTVIWVEVDCRREGDSFLPPYLILSIIKGTGSLLEMSSAQSFIVYQRLDHLTRLFG